VLCLCWCSGCSTSRQNADPWQSVNQPIFALNDNLDRIALKPLSQGYKAITPRPVRRAIGNFFNNIGYLDTTVNLLLQGKPLASAKSLWRFSINSIFGFGGLMDLASQYDVLAEDEDFGQTLAVWGVPQGQYLMLPLLGPSTTREILGIPVSQATNILYYIANSSILLPISTLRIIHQRSELDVLDNLPEDRQSRYIVVRDAYLQRREFLASDGKKNQADKIFVNEDGLFDDIDPQEN
jgi:phospholipid-binding lipoprotein MlaA